MTLDEALLEAALRRREEFEAAQDAVERSRGEFNRSIRHLHIAGGSMREIAEALGLSHQRVHQIVEAGQPVEARETSTMTDLLVCQFCDKNQTEVAKLIAGPGTYICDTCVARAHAVGDADGTDGDLLTAEAKCGFCGKGFKKVDWVVERAGRSSICNECVALCEEILAGEVS